MPLKAAAAHLRPLAGKSLSLDPGLEERIVEWQDLFGKKPIRRKPDWVCPHLRALPQVLNRPAWLLGGH